MTYADMSSLPTALPMLTSSLTQITTTIYHDDIVPRLSYGSLVDLKRTMLAVLQDPASGGSNLKRIFQTIAAGNQLGPGLTRRLEELLHCPATPVLDAPQTERADRLYVAGRVFFIYRKGRHRHIEFTSPSLFADIILSPTIFVDHMPYEYQDNFQLVLDLMNTREGKPHTHAPIEPNVGSLMDLVLVRPDDDMLVVAEHLAHADASSQDALAGGLHIEQSQ